VAQIPRTVLHRARLAHGVPMDAAVQEQHHRPRRPYAGGGTPTLADASIAERMSGAIAILHGGHGRRPLPVPEREQLLSLVVFGAATPPPLAHEGPTPSRSSSNGRSSPNSTRSGSTSSSASHATTRSRQAVPESAPG